MSRPVWGAWIEIMIILLLLCFGVSRAPYGARGLKYDWDVWQEFWYKSRPVWGAWIEMG